MGTRAVPPRSILLKSLRDDRLQIAGYALALAVMAAAVVYLWPSYRDTLVTVDLPSAVEAILGSELSFATGPGFISAEFYSWVPALLLVYAITKGTGAVAGEESSGTMDLLLAQPVRRRDLALQKTAAFVAGSAVIVLAGWLGFAASVPFVDINVTLSGTLAANLNMLPIVWMFYGVAFWLGAVAPSRGTAAAIAVALAVGSWFTNALATVEPISWLRYASPFYYYGAGRPLVEGINWLHAGLLCGIGLGATGGGLRAFERRDVTMGGAASLRLREMLRRATA
jgi:ABC-2 type transport system permease protein